MRDEKGRRLVEPIDPFEQEIREIEERIYQLKERMSDGEDERAEHILAFDNGMLTACCAILDEFLGGDEARDGWLRERDEARMNAKLLAALEKHST